MQKTRFRLHYSRRRADRETLHYAGRVQRRDHVENEIPDELFEKHGPLSPVRRKAVLTEISRNCDHPPTMWALKLGAARSVLCGDSGTWRRFHADCCVAGVADIRRTSRFERAN